MSARKTLSGPIQSTKVAVNDNKDEVTSEARQRLASAMELLSVAVASVFDNGEVLVNKAFTQQLGLRDSDNGQISATLRRSIITAVQDNPTPSNVSWLEGKRSFEREIDLATSGNEKARWRARIASLRFAQTRVRQLQLLHLIDETTNNDSNVDSRVYRERPSAAPAALDPAQDPLLDQLEHSQWSFRESVANSEFPMAIRTGCIIQFVNQAFADLLGFDNVDSLVGIDVLSILPEREVDRIVSKIQRRDSGKNVRNGYRLTFYHTDGREIPTRTFSRRIVWNGEPSAHSVCIDVTEEDQTNRALAESEDRLQAILAGLPCGMIVHRNGKLLYVNPAMVKMMGYSSAEEVLAQKSMWPAFPEHEKLKTLSEKRIIGRAELDSYETVLKNVDGTLLKVRVLPDVIDWNGENVVVASLTDVTDLSNALDLLRLDETRSRDFASTAASWFWETDQNDRFTMIGNEYANYSKFTGINRDSILGKTRAELYPEQREAYPQRWETYERAISARRPFNDFEMTIEGDDDSTHSFLLSGIPYFSDEGDYLGYRGSVRDVSEERRLQARISYAAEHDDLTGLPNRTKFARFVDSSLDATRDTEKQCVLGFLDLDGFKIVNDTVGHSVGDKLLVQCAAIFKRIVQKPHRIARLGGDEFGFLLHDLSIDEANAIFQTIITAVSRNKFLHDGRCLEVGASIGVVVVNNNSESRETLMSQADVACYAAKDNGRNQVYLYSKSDEDARRRHREVRVASDIQQALVEGRMLIYAQPIVDLNIPGNPPVHNEILIRMKDTDGSIIGPNAFIPAAERFQLAETLDRHVINAALALLSEAYSSNARACVGISINLSGETLSVPDFDKFVLDALNRYDVKPDSVCFEITETAAIRNLDVAIRFIESTRALGCHFSLDDFGAGLSSFAYLKDFNIDQIKIDGRFIRNVVNDQFDKNIVSAISHIGSSLGVSVVAEHVEDEASARILRQLGVDYGQGYLWGRPVPYQQILDQQDR